MHYKEFLKPQQILGKKVSDYHQVVFETLGFALSEESYIGDYKSTFKFSPFSIKIYSQNVLKKKICTFYYCSHIPQFSHSPEFKLEFALPIFGHMGSAHLQLMKIAMKKKLQDLKVFSGHRPMYIHSFTFAKKSFHCSWVPLTHGCLISEEILWLKTVIEIERWEK